MSECGNGVAVECFDFFEKFCGAGVEFIVAFAAEKIEHKLNYDVNNLFILEKVKGFIKGQSELKNGDAINNPVIESRRSGNSSSYNLITGYEKAA